MIYTNVFNNYEYIENGYVLKKELDIILYYARMTDGNIIELGCNMGDTTYAIAKACPDKTIYAIDYDIATNKFQEGESKGLFLHCKDLKNVVCINTNSQTIDLNQFSYVTLAFIDADHTYAGVRKDYENMREIINQGHILLHDCNVNPQSSWVEVYKLIDEIDSENYILKFEDTNLAVITI